MQHSMQRLAEATYTPSEHQRRVDEIQAAIRAESDTPLPSLFRPPPERSAPSIDELDHRLSEELEYVRRHLDELGGVLTSDPLLLDRHAAELQSIDLVNQILGHLAKIIASEDKKAAVGQVTLTELKGRLQPRSLYR